MALHLARETGCQSIGVYAAEEGLSATLGHRLRCTGLARPGVDVLMAGGVEDLIAWCVDNPGSCLIIDSVSVTQLLPSDLRALADQGGLTCLIAVSQATKGGDHAGPLALSHEVDVVVSVERLQWSVTKSRYGASGVGGSVAPAVEEVEHV